MAAPAYQGGHVNTNAAAQSLTMNLTTAGAATGDFMIAFMYQSENTGAQVWDDDGGGGNGWTREVYNRTTSGRDQETAIYWKFHDGSESNPTFTWNSGGTNEPMTGILLVYDNVDTVEPFTEITQLLGNNDCNPPNQDVRIDYANTKVICYHAATHDDISSVGAPTGFTIRDYQYGGSAGHTQDHRDAFTADIEIDTLGNYSPPDWTHGASNTTPEYHTYSVALNEAQPIHITAPANNTKYQWTDTNKTITGDGFEATQNTGKVELWSDESGTTKVTQDIDTWSDTSIQFDFVQSTLVDGVNYLVVTNHSGDVSKKVPLAMGFGPYEPWVSTDADHYWKMNNAYTDEAARGGAKDFDNVQTGTPTFSATPITRTNTHSFLINQAVESSEIADSAYTNITNTHTYRNIGGWVRMENLQETPSIIYEEGGGVNNIYALMNPNGRLVINVADSSGTPDFKYQHYSDFPLITSRPYHIMIDAEFGDHFDLWIDGEKQTGDHAGTLGADTTMSTHSGDWTFGDADANLDTGGVDIAYAAANTMYMAHWGTWSGAGGGAPLTSSEIKTSLFRDGALQEHTIDADTEANMQTDIESYDSQTHADWPLTYEIEDVTGSGDMTLEITDQVWPDEVKFQIRWLGAGELTIKNIGTSNFVSAKGYAPNSGTFAVEYKPTLTITGLPTAGVEVRIYADSGSGVAGAELDGAEDVTTGSFSTYLTATDDIIITIFDEEHDPIRELYTVPSSDVSLSLAPLFDRWYLNPETGGVDTYYFDGSDAAATETGSGTSWSNITNADDGSTTTDATVALTGSNNSKELVIEGTDASSSGTITQVRARMYGSVAGDGVCYTDITTDGDAEEIYSGLALPYSEGWSSYVTLSTPTGGWSWAKLQALETRSIGSASGSDVDLTLSRIEIEVTYT